MQNPFSYTFGIKPKEFIRNEQTEIILKNFSYRDPTERAFMITGVRGSGKTVMLADLSEQLEADDNWLIIDLNPSRDLLQSLAAQLYELPFMKAYFVDKKIDLSLLGLGVSIEKGTGIFDIESAIEKMLRAIQKEGKRVLLTIDEAAPGKDMQIFCLSFQRFIRKRLPVYMILTGLFQNIHNIKDMEGCTFLQRAPFIVLNPLDTSAIMLCYKRVLDVSKARALELARLTRGYAFGFQILGKLYFDERPGEENALEDLLLRYESELITYSYNKIWSELSGKDRQVVITLASLDPDQPIPRKVLMENLGFSSSLMNRYQIRLKEKGILEPTQSGYGKYAFALPRFGQFVLDYHA